MTSRHVIDEVRADQDRLVELRRLLQLERDICRSPAVERYLTLADQYVYLALSATGWVEDLFPDQRLGATTPQGTDP